MKHALIIIIAGLFATCDTVVSPEPDSCASPRVEREIVAGGDTTYVMIQEPCEPPVLEE